MTQSAANLQRRLRTAARLLMVGMGVEAITLLWADPTSFLLFLGVGGVLVVAGVVTYLKAIVSS